MSQTTTRKPASIQHPESHFGPLWDDGEVEYTEVVEGRTILGRRRLINPEASNWDRFQSKTNLVVQGACADGIKLALCEIRKRLPRSVWIIAIVHDEIIVEAPEAKAEQVKKLLAKIMVSVFDKLFKKQVPIEVDAKICENWGENEGVCDVWLLKLGVKSPSKRILEAAKVILASW